MRPLTLVLARAGARLGAIKRDDQAALAQRFLQHSQELADAPIVDPQSLHAKDRHDVLEILRPSSEDFQDHQV